MKEVTIWDGRPRWMWVWDFNEVNKTKELVTCILTDEQMKELGIEQYPVCGRCCNYQHCADIKEEKRPCTREELLGMLKMQGLPMLLVRNDDSSTSFIIESIGVDNVYIAGNYSYEELCEHYTLLNGSELWITEEQNEE